MKIAIFLIGVVLCSVFTANLAEETEEFKCEEEVPYKENDCNGCFCQNGNLGCTLMGCTTHTNPEYMNCKVGTTWSKGCNQCWCVHQMGTICSDKSC